MYLLGTPALLVLIALPGISANLHQLMKAAGKLYFGSATDNGELSDVAYVNILRDANEFGQITPGNGQKWQFTEPAQNQFSWTAGDQIAAFASGNGQLLRCHTLVWHSQLPNWVSSGSWTPTTLTNVINNHIANEVGHYKGKCYAWDVVNEALEEDGSYRASVFYNVLGTSYIPLAFKAAAEADPTAKLYYNDYNIEHSGAKQQAVLGIIAAIQAAGARIDGVGLQGHFIVGNTPGRSALVRVLDAYVAAGVAEVAYTEVDIRFASLPASAAGRQQQAVDYVNVVGACLDVPACVGVTVWDFTDKYSWIPSVFAGQGDACLFSSDLAPKPAYASVSSLLRAAATDVPTASSGTAATTSTPTSSLGIQPSITTTLVTSTRTLSPTRPTAIVLAQRWGQCAGIGWTGPKACACPWRCEYQNDWYSLCL